MLQAKLTVTPETERPCLDKEAALLGAMILDTTFVSALKELLSKHPFAWPKDRAAFDSLLRVYETLRTAFLPSRGALRDFLSHCRAGPRHAAMQYIQLLLCGTSRDTETIAKQVREIPNGERR